MPACCGMLSGALPLANWAWTLRLALIPPQVNVGCVPKKVRLFCQRLRWQGLALGWVPVRSREVLAQGVGKQQGLGGYCRAIGMLWALLWPTGAPGKGEESGGLAGVSLSQPAVCVGR